MPIKHMINVDEFDRTCGSPQLMRLSLARMAAARWSTEVTDRDDMPLGLHDPRAEARRTEAVLDPSAVGGVHEAAGQRDAVSRAVARDKPVATSVVIPR